MRCPASELLVLSLRLGLGVVKRSSDDMMEEKSGVAHERSVKTGLNFDLACGQGLAFLHPGLKTNQSLGKNGPSFSNANHHPPRSILLLRTASSILSRFTSNPTHLPAVIAGTDQNIGRCYFTEIFSSNQDRHSKRYVKST